jgi:hypothetical protein
MRVGIICGGTIARLILEHVRRGDLGRARVVAILGRDERSRGKQLAKAFRVPFVSSLRALLAAKPDVVVEAAAHDAVREHGEPLLKKGVALIVLSCGALCDDALRTKLERAAAKSGALLSVPSGGIGGLDALKAACVAGVDEVTIAVTKPPAAWKGSLRREAPGGPRRAAGGTHPVRRAGPRGRAAFSRQREHRGGALHGGDRLRPDPAQGRGGPGAQAQHPLHRGEGPHRQHQRQARERAGAGQSQDRVACVLQRARGVEGGQVAGAIWNIIPPTPLC